MLGLTHNQTKIPEISPLIAYPIGSVYLSVSPTNPATLFGGSWAQIKDVFLLAAGAVYQAGSTGGESKHTLTVNEMPNHSHIGIFAGEGTEVQACTWQGDANDRFGFRSMGANLSGWHLNTGTAGSGSSHNNMPPYLTVYMWKRTA